MLPQATEIAFVTNVSDSNLGFGFFIWSKTQVTAGENPQGGKFFTLVILALIMELLLTETSRKTVVQDRAS